MREEHEGAGVAPRSCADGGSHVPQHRHLLRGHHYFQLQIQYLHAGFQRNLYRLRECQAWRGGLNDIVARGES
jgi:hypothetical protein